MEKEEIEVKDFYFHQLRKINIGDPAVSDGDRCSLLCVSNKFGLTFVGTKNGVLVFETCRLHDVDKDDTIGPKKVNADISSLSPTLLATPTPPLHVALSSENLTLSVCVQEGGLLKCYFYDTRALSQGKGTVIVPFDKIPLSAKRGICLSALTWSPTSDELLVVSLTSGDLKLIHVKEKVSLLSHKTDLHANSICWSPKGKQFVVGLKSGKILQLLPKTLDVKKEFPCPDIFNGVAQQVTDLFWVSTYVFAVVYTPLDPSDKTPFLVFLSAPKDQQPVFTNWEDIYYGGGTKENKFFFIYMSVWKVLITSSANALEAAVFAQKVDSDAVWHKWEMEDTGRAEIPLHGDNETYTAGMALDLTSQHDVPISETLTLPPCPLLLLYSDHGVLCPFTVIKTTALAQALKLLVTPPFPLPNDHKLIRQPQQSSTSSAPVVSSTSALPPSSVQPLVGALSQPSSLPGYAPSLLGSITGSLGSSGAPRPLAPVRAQTLNGLAPAQNKPPVSTLAQTFAGLGTPIISSQEAERRAQVPLNQTIQMGKLGGPPLFSSTPLVPAGTQPPASQPLTNKPQNISQQQPGTQVLGSQAFGGNLLGTHQLRSGPPFLGTTLGTQPSSSQLSDTKPSTSQPLAAVQLPGLSVNAQTESPGVQQLSVHPLSHAQPATSQQPMGSKPLQLPNSQPLLSRLPLTQNQMPVFLQAGGSRLNIVPSNVVQPTQALVSASIGARPPAPQTSVLQLSTQSPRPQLVSQLPRPPPVYQPPRPQLGGQLHLPQSVGPFTTQLPGSHTTGMRPPISKPPATHPSSGASIAALSSPQQLTKPQFEGRRDSTTHQGPSGHPLQPSIGRNPPRTQDDSEALGHRQVEADFANKIQEEIDWYTNELEELKVEMLGVFGEWEGVTERESMELGSLGKMKDLRNICDAVYEVETVVCGTKKKFEALQKKCDALEEDVLKGCEIHEEARNNLRKKTDPNNVSLLKLRPLDSYSSNRLNDIRSSFIHAEQSITEVNSQLDAQLEEMYERKRQAGRDLLKAPSIQTVYSSLRNHRRIARMQSSNINQIVRDMKQLRLIPRSWQPSDAVVQPSSPSFSPQASPSKPTASQPARDSSETAEASKMSRDKIKKLRESFGNMTVTPVRTLKPAPLYTLGTGEDTPQSYAQSDAGQIAVPGSYHSGTTTPFESGQVSPTPPSFDGDSTRLSYYGDPITTTVSGGPLSVPSQSSLGSQLSLLTQPDVVVGLNKKVSVRTPRGFKNVDSISAVPPQRVDRQSSIDVNVSPDRNISIMTPLGFQQQRDLSSNPPRYVQPQQKQQQSQAQSPSRIQGGTVHWGSPTTTTATAQTQQQTLSYVSPRSVLPGATAGIHPGPRMPLPQFGAVGLSQQLPVCTTSSPQPAPPSRPLVSAPPPGSGLSFSTTSGFSLLGSKLSSSGPLNYSATSKSPGVQPSGSSVPVSTLGELKRSDPLGDLTSIQSSAGATVLNLGAHSSTSFPNICFSQSEMPPLPAYSQSSRPLATTATSATIAGPPPTTAAQLSKPLSLQTPVFGMGSITTPGQKVNLGASPGLPVSQPQLLFGLTSQPESNQSSARTSSSTPAPSAIVTTASGPGATPPFVFSGVPNFSFSTPQSKTTAASTLTGTAFFGRSPFTGVSLTPSTKSTTPTTSGSLSSSATTAMMGGPIFSGLPLSPFKITDATATTSTPSATITSGPATTLNFSSIPMLGSTDAKTSSGFQVPSLGPLSTGSKPPFMFGVSSASNTISASPSAPFVFGMNPAVGAMSTGPQLSTNQPPPSSAVTRKELRFNVSQILQAGETSQKPKAEDEGEESIVEKKDPTSVKLDTGAHPPLSSDQITPQTSIAVVTKPGNGDASVQSESKSESSAVAPNIGLEIPTLAMALPSEEQSTGDKETALKATTSGDKQEESPTPSEEAADKETPLASREGSKASVLSGPSVEEGEVAEETETSRSGEEKTLNQEAKLAPQLLQSSGSVQEGATAKPEVTTQDTVSVSLTRKEDIMTKFEKENQSEPLPPTGIKPTATPVEEKPLDKFTSLPPLLSSSAQTQSDPPLITASVAAVTGDRSTPQSTMDEVDDEEMGEMEENNVETLEVKTSQEQSSIIGGGGLLGFGGLGGRPSNPTANPFGPSTLQSSSVDSTPFGPAAGANPGGGGFLRPSVFGGSGTQFGQTTKSGMSGDAIIGNLGSSSSSSVGATPGGGGGLVFGSSAAFGSPPQIPAKTLFGGKLFGSPGAAQQAQPFGGGGGGGGAFQSSGSSFGSLAQQQPTGLGGGGAGLGSGASGTSSGSMGGSSFNQWR